MTIKEFVKKWSGRGNEKQETQQFWNDIIFNVLSAPADTVIQYEKPVKINGQTKFIDAYLPDTRVLIEQKSLGIDLMKTELQSDGMRLTPYEQGRRYGGYLPFDEQPRWIIDSNFAEIRVHDMKKPGDPPEIIKLKDMGKDYTRLMFMVDTEDEHLKRELELSLKAGELVGKIHDRFLEQYNDPLAKKTQNSLNILCTRLVFCMYAEDAGLFGSKDAFSDYIGQYEPGDVRQALLYLFKVLDTPEDERADMYLSKRLEAFPYCNGGLFANENIVIPRITQEIKDTLLDAAGFDWADISPTIFGAVFESTLNAETRRSGGMHYTSIENIHKVIDPLFLDDLKAELADIMDIKVQKTKEAKLRAYQNKLASLKFLDPACGSGNFLTETYISLRRLENEVLRELYNGQIVLGDAINPIKVSIDQFYGFEINDFAVTVAKTALWIAEAQMMQETEDIVSMHLNFLPLKTNATIVECNALRIDWWRYVDRHSLSYIMGNPPFVANSGRVSAKEASVKAMMSNTQKEEKQMLFGKSGGVLDYVACWFKKAADYMEGTRIHAAFVSTNSICQGEQVAPLWKPLFAHGIVINIAYRSFKWRSEASKKATVFVVIIGFSYEEKPIKVIYDDNGKKQVSHINAYLVEAPDIFAEKRTRPISKDALPMHRGSQPTDDGNLIFTEQEYKKFVRIHPDAKPLFKEFMMGKDFIDRKPRFCLWLADINPAEIKRFPPLLNRIEAVRTFRSNSSKQATRKKADIPYLFDENQQPSNNYVAIPEVSSGDRRYVPMDFMTPNIVVGNKIRIAENATLYDFGVLTSNVHMAWMRATCGYYGPSYQYSINIVYNNFPWPSPTNEQKAKIDATAKGILDARAKYPDSSLADLYDELTMPFELRKAHQANDRAVMEAYGFSLKMTEQECVAELMKMYQILTEDK